MVTIYSKNNCVQCKMTKRFLDTNHVEYREINLDEQPEYIDHVKSLGFNAAPVIQIVGEGDSRIEPELLGQLFPSGLVNDIFNGIPVYGFIIGFHVDYFLLFQLIFIVYR